MLRVQFYGVLEQVAGNRELRYPLESAQSVEDVLQRLQAELPALAEHLPRVACAVDDRVVPRNGLVQPGATLALLPPVSGG